MINIFVFYLGCVGFYKYDSNHLEYLIKALESLKCFKPVLSRLIIKNSYSTIYGSLAHKAILSKSRF